MPRWIKVIVAAALLVALAFTVDWDELRGHAADIDWAVATVALLAIAIEMPVNATKWYWSLRLHGQTFPWSYLFRIGCMACARTSARVCMDWKGAGGNGFCSPWKAWAADAPRPQRAASARVVVFMACSFRNG